MPMDDLPQTVVEMPEFATFANSHLSDDERMAVIDFVSRNPLAGDLLQGTGGLRKFRWAVGGKGKSGGVRIIHYFHGKDLPVFLVTGFAKSKMENISPAARSMYRKLLPLIVDAYKGLHR